MSLAHATTSDQVTSFCTQSYWPIRMGQGSQLHFITALQMIQSFCPFPSQGRQGNGKLMDTATLVQPVSMMMVRFKFVRLIYMTLLISSSKIGTLDINDV